MLIVDLETQSSVNLRKSGGFVYAESPDTRLLTVAWVTYGTEDYHVWIPMLDSVSERDRNYYGLTNLHVGPELPPELEAARGDIWYGHNAWAFDEPVWAACTGKPPRKWWDSQGLAAAAGLPLGLDAIGKLLFGQGKEEIGKAALDKAKRTTERPGTATLLSIAKYNIQDVWMTNGLMQRLGIDLHLTQFERQVQEMHRDMIAYGAEVDQALLSRLYDVADQTTEAAFRRIQELTGGLFKDRDDLNKRNKVFSWIAAQGMEIKIGDKWVPAKVSSLAKDKIQAWIEDMEDELPEESIAEDDGDSEATIRGPFDKVAEVLRLRGVALRVTKNKLAAAALGMNRDGRMRGIVAYHAAGTGRWGGRRFQPQNLPSPPKDFPFWPLIDLGADLTYDKVTEVLKDTAFSPMDAAAYLIRGLIQPKGGILAADFASIEVRVLCYMAGEKWMLETFEQGWDAYVKFCHRITGRMITKKDDERSVWKAILLGCGFGMGSNTFALTAAKDKVDLTAAGLNAESAVEAYRTAHPMIAGEIAGEFNGRAWRKGGMWKNLGNACINTADDGVPRSVCMCRIYRENGHMYMALPSGRELVYRNVKVVEEINKFGKLERVLYYYSSRGYHKKLLGSLLNENVVQAVARDILANSMVNLRGAGFQNIFSVHDEPVCVGVQEREDEFLAIASTPPPWLPNFPLDVEGGWQERYSKTARGVEKKYYNGSPR